MPRSLFNAEEIADYFLANVDEEAGDNISNLKLQKLLYYAQGLHVAMHGEPLFSEPLVAWEHGPVVESIYHRFKSYRWQGIDRPVNFDPTLYPPEIREFLDVVYGVYGQFTAKRLETMTHEEPPWSRTHRNEEITLQALGEFFSKLVDAGRANRAVVGEPLWPIGDFRHQRRDAISRRMAPHRDRLGEIARAVTEADDPWADED